MGLLFLGFVVGGVLGGIFLYHFQARRNFENAFVDDPDYELVPRGVFSPPEIRSRPGAHLPIRCKAIAGNRNTPARWQLFVDGVALKTTLSLSLEGLLGGLRDLVGLKDIQVGDEAFDGRYTIRGADADLVRGAILQPAVRRAVDVLYGHRGVKRCNLSYHGTLEVLMQRERLTPQEARHVLVVVHTLAQALHDARHAEPVGPPVPKGAGKEAIGSVGGTSGAPVGLGGRFFER